MRVTRLTGGTNPGEKYLVYIPDLAFFKKSDVDRLVGATKPGHPASDALYALYQLALFEEKLWSS